jgi:hypothetical protein
MAGPRQACRERVAPSAANPRSRRYRGHSALRRRRDRPAHTTGRLRRGNLIRVESHWVSYVSNLRESNPRLPTGTDTVTTRLRRTREHLHRTPRIKCTPSCAEVRLALCRQIVGRLIISAFGGGDRREETIDSSRIRTTRNFVQFMTRRRTR